MIRPTRRCIQAWGAGLVVAALPVIAGEGFSVLWFGFIAAVSAATMIDALIGVPRSRVSAAIEAPERLYIGESDPLEVRYRVASRRAASLEVLVDLDEELEPQPVRRVEVEPATDAVVTFTLRPRRRGNVVVEALWTRWEGPLGLMRRTAHQRLDRVIPAVPNIRAVRARAIEFHASRDFASGLKVERYLGDGSEFEALREFLPGYDHRALDWKASARHRKLLVREYRAERNHQVILAFDTGHLMREEQAGIPKLDHSVNAALQLAYCCLKTGDRVGLFAFDDRVRFFVDARSGTSSLPAIQDKTADLEYSTAETNFTLGLAELSTRLRRRSLVVVFTEFADAISAELMVENVGRLAQRHLVLFVTLNDPELRAVAVAEPQTTLDVHRAVVAGRLLKEREVVQAQLKRMGVHCVDATPETFSSKLLNRYLEIRRRELI